MVDSNPHTFHLEQAFIIPDDAQGIQLLGRTPGFRPDLIVEARRLALLTTPPANPAMPSALAILRMESAEYLVAKAGRDAEGRPRLHFILIPAAALRWLGGNLHRFESLVFAPIPVMPSGRSAGSDDLPPFVLENPEPPDAVVQTDDMLALLRACKNDTKTATGILAALIQSVPVAVIAAPAEWRARAAFIGGLLALLPIPARVPMTFATSATDPHLNVAIKFLEPGTYAEGHLVFDWTARKLLDAGPDDPYAKYMVRQLKLDPSLVIEQTDRLARTAVWRAMRKDDMAEALNWIARRAGLDAAVLNNQPADRAKVAAVLREDPTLAEDMRGVYASHLVRFSLALNDAEYTDVIPLIAEQNPAVGDAIYEDLVAATKTKNAEAVYKIAEHWLGNPPMGADTSRWIPLLGMALNTMHSDLILRDDADALKAFLEKLLDTPPLVPLGSVVAGFLQSTYKKAYRDADIARLLFLLAATHLQAGALARLLSDPEFVAVLPISIREALPHLTPNRVQAAPPGLLNRTAFLYGAERYNVVLARLTEWAFSIQRRDLIDAEALHGLVAVAASPQGTRFDGLLQTAIQSFSSPDYIRAMPGAMVAGLIALNLARGRSEDAAVQVQYYQDQVFRATEVMQLGIAVHEAFVTAPLDTRQVTEALNSFQNADLRPAVKIGALYGALEAQKYNGTADGSAKRLTAFLVNEPRLIGLNGLSPALRLLKFHTDRKDVGESARLANALVDYLVTGTDTPDTVNPADAVNTVRRISSLINWSPDMADTALEVMRSYIRRTTLDHAQHFVTQTGDQMGTEGRRVLETTFAVRRIMDGLEFEQFAEVIEMTALILVDMAATFAPGPEVMPIFKLRRTAQSVTGGLSEREMFQLSDNFTTLGELLMRLYWAHQQTTTKRSRQETEQQRNALMFGSIAPATGIEVLQWLGGRFGAGQKQLDLSRMAAPHFLSNRSQNELIRDTTLMIALFEGLLTVFPDKAVINIHQDAWANEINAAYENLSLQKQRHWHDTLGLNAQYLWQAVREIGMKGNDKNLGTQAQGRLLYLGKAQPRSVIDSLRWLSGYFANAHE